jgi:tetratricopeptide (TPR) repeat protein
LPCLKCGGQTVDEALLCDSCAESSFQEPKYFLNPVLIGPSLYSRLRASSSAAYMLGPTSESDVITIPSTNLDKIVQDLNPQTIPHEDLKGFYQRCDTILAHLGVPLKLDSQDMLLTEDAADTIMSIILKVNVTEKIYQLEAMSDLYIRIGVVYWSATNGILMKTASKKWSGQRKAYLVSRAKEYFSKVAPGDDLHSIAARNLGMLCLDAEEWLEAEEHLTDAQRNFPNDVEIGEGIARAHLMLGNQVEALSKVDEVINLGETPELWVLKGRILRDMDRYEEAIECFNRALSIDPRYVPAHDILISSLRDAGRLEEATLAENQKGLSKRPGLERKINEIISEFQVPGAVEKAPEAPSVKALAKPAPRPGAVVAPAPSSLDFARKALRAGDYDTAIQSGSEVLRGKPGSRDAELLLIEAYISNGDMKGASPMVHSFYERNRGDPIAWYWRGVLADKEGRWGASIQYFSKAVSLDPNLVDAWISMGEVLLGNDKPVGADESFSKVLQIDEENPRAWLGKAKVMKQMGRWGAAVQCLDRYNSLVPTDKASWLLKADTLFDKEKWERAVESYDKYLEMNQADSYALGKKGIALNAIGRIDEARESLEESVRLDPKNKEAAKWLRTLNSGGEA